ncbi:DUF1707 domain-containing protein [Rhodococcus kroppenstedtii]|uniref:DUF1707 SHOCT-like domain-containing protein n=1 Tax=Rhodococcoides kroppenstedtii TaxID=293050 RepID=UPI002954E658|nr:DUF1707 domain-containing protein [Rhodococcus kroppenstedtii]MDV7197398.1 DUF1707 domain-containing protein [Rhodococcus kroppenstedtii]
MADSPDVRIGTAERERAFSLLGEHFAAGRLSPAEFDERSAAAGRAVTRGELVPLFADLPGAAADLVPSATAAPAPSVSSETGAPKTDAGRDWRRAVMALVPIAALVLFFVTGTWLWFLAIPAAGAILFAGRDDR